MSFTSQAEQSIPPEFASPALNALRTLANLVRLEQQAATAGDSDLRWKYREEVPAALEEAQRVLDEAASAPVRFYSLSLTQYGPETDEYKSDDDRQAWFDNQRPDHDDHYFLDIDRAGQLIDAGIANVGEAVEDEEDEEEAHG